MVNREIGFPTLLRGLTPDAIGINCRTIIQFLICTLNGSKKMEEDYPSAGVS